MAGADDAVMLDQRGFVAETNATHIFLVSGGVLRTPTTAACPEGITRQAVLDLAAEAGICTAIGDYSLTQLYCADEIFVTGTMGGLTPVLAAGRQAHRRRQARTGDSPAGGAVCAAHRHQRDARVLTRSNPQNATGQPAIPRARRYWQ